MTEHAVLTRKDIALKLGPNVSERKVRENEKRWGLYPARVKSSNKPILYCGEKAIAALKSIGLLS